MNLAWTPKGRHLLIYDTKIWWTLSSDLSYHYMPPWCGCVSGRRNCPVWYADY